MIWKRGAKGFSIAMFVLAVFVFYEAGRIYFIRSNEEPVGEQVITSPQEHTSEQQPGVDEKPTPLGDEVKENKSKIDNNDQYMSAPPTDENGDPMNQ